ncbi:MAG: ATP-binding cassette domain-containing protein [Armatimonadetes bacterium]|nr:ATP-binding cassette domain-containing protein [Armatimonadota bacterium]
MTTVLECDDLRFAYGATEVLCGVSFSLPAHGFVGLIGANGCGKSTLMRLLLGLLTPTTGRVSILGEPPLAAVRRGEVGYVPQRDTFSRTFPLSVQDVVVMGRSGRIGLGRRPSQADRDAALAALERVGAVEWRRRSFGRLSGGQQRLVLVARALAQEPRVLLMDEADTGLDERRRQHIYDVLAEVRRERDLSILAISYQFDVLAGVVDSAVALRDGRSVEWCPTHMTHALAEHLEPTP